MADCVCETVASGSAPICICFWCWFKARIPYHEFFQIITITITQNTRKVWSVLLLLLLCVRVQCDNTNGNRLDEEAQSKNELYPIEFDPPPTTRLLVNYNNFIVLLDILLHRFHALHIQSAENLFQIFFFIDNKIKIRKMIRWIVWVCVCESGAAMSEWDDECQPSSLLCVVKIKLQRKNC